MKPKEQNTSYEELFREFVARQLDRKYSPRRVGRAAACQEFVKYEIDLGQNPLPEEGSRVLIWKNSEGIYRFASLDVSVADSQTITIDLSADQGVAKVQTDLLKEDIAKCNHRLPIAVCIEPREACSTVAAQQVQPWVDAYRAASLVNRNSAIITKAISQQLSVPVSSKTVFEGFIQASEVKKTTAPIHITCITGQL